MPKTITRDTVIEELQRVEGLNQRLFQLGTSRTEFTQAEDGSMLFRLSNGSAQEYALTKSAFVKAAQFCGIPKAYVKRFPPEELWRLSEHLNFWFSHRDEEMKLLLKDDTVVAFMKPGIDYYSRIALLEAVERAIAPNGNVDALVYDKLHVSMADGIQLAIVSEKHADMGNNDIVRGGIQIQDHVLGDLGLQLSAYVYRLVCSNGMMAAENIAKWNRRSNADNLLDWAEEAARACHDSIEHEFARTQHLKTMPVHEHGAEILSSIFAAYKLPPAQREVITDYVINHGAETLYDIFNAITAAANHPDFADQPGVIRALQLAAGGVVQNPETCPICHTPILN